MTYKFIKSSEQMVSDLYNLWGNYPLYKFIHGAQYIRKRELEICECLPDIDGKRHMFIELTRFDWLMLEDSKKKKKKP
jgi:hypothetical protein